MAKKLYVPVKTGQQTLSKEAKKIYAPVKSGNAYLSKIAKKAYCSVNGVSKLFWGGEPTVIKPFWFYYATKADSVNEFMWDKVYPAYTRKFYKTSNGICFFAFFIGTTSGGDQYYMPILVSTDRNAVRYKPSDGGEYVGPMGSFDYEYYNDGYSYTQTWYWNGIYPVDIGTLNPYPTGYSPNCLYSSVPRPNNSDLSKSAREMMTGIYGNDFAYAYQAGQTYPLVIGDIEKLIRKAFAIWLFWMFDFPQAYTQYEVAYNLILENLETAVAYFKQQAGNNPIIDIGTYTDNGNFGFLAYYGNGAPANILIDSGEDSGYAGYGSYFVDDEVSYNKGAEIIFKSDGTIDYNTFQTSFDDYIYIGMANPDIRYMSISNLGLRFQGT